MKRFGELVFFAGVLASLAGMAADDYVITEGETHDFARDAGPYALLNNQMTTPVTLTQSDAAAPRYATVFSGFRSSGSSTTTFDGTYFDFGAGTFFDSSEGGASRKVYLGNGAIVSNVASVSIGPSWSDNNRVELTGASAMHVTGNFSVSCQGNSCPQNNKVSVLDGSTLAVGGTLAVGTVKAGADKRLLMNNRLVVSNANTYVKVAALRLGADGAGDAQAWVTDHARLDVTGATTVGGSGGRTLYNKLFVADGGVVTTKTLYVSADWQSAVDGRLSEDGVYVLDGGEMYVTGDMQLGYSSSGSYGKPGFRLVVSNGVFGVGGKAYMFGQGKSNNKCEVRISGPRAKMNVTSTGRLFANAGQYNQFIVENGATFAYPWRDFGSTGVQNETVLVRGTGTKMTFGGFSTSGGGDSTGIQSRTNHLCAVDGADVSGSLLILSGDSCELAVSNATFSLSYSNYETIGTEPVGSGDNLPALSVGALRRYGGLSTNGIVTISGNCPKLICKSGASAQFRRSAKIVFNLPSEGYDDGIIPFDVGKRLTVESGCRIVLNGLAAMEDALYRRPGGNQTLIRAKTLNIASDVLADLRATLPADFRLKLTGTAGTEQRLVLHRRQGTAVLLK